MGTDAKLKNRRSILEEKMKTRITGAALLLLTIATAAYAAAPEAVHSVAKACGLPCC